MGAAGQTTFSARMGNSRGCNSVAGKVIRINTHTHTYIYIYTYMYVNTQTCICTCINMGAVGQA